jgi:L-serine deaminase
MGSTKVSIALSQSEATKTSVTVSLDEAIEAMRLTAEDMSHKYKETSLSVSFHNMQPMYIYHNQLQ